MNLLGDFHSAAHISEDGRYRAQLRRTWDESKEPAVFIMLNPSTADAMVDDPTIRRCVGFARSWNLGGIFVVNLFQLRATDPRELLKGGELNPPDADAWITKAVSYTEVVIAAWGTVKKPLRYRTREVAALVAAQGKRLMALKTSKDGSPYHPLYLKADLTPAYWQAN